MSEYTATIAWTRGGAPFVGHHYSRGHSWFFDGGVEVPASASPHSVPHPHSIEAAVDPEEAFVASISSCHMLWFLWIAANKGFVVDDYRDEAVGIMGRNPKGKIAMVTVRLRPLVSFSGTKTPTKAEVTALHHEAHETCYIASSITTEVTCEPVYGEISR